MKVYTKIPEPALPDVVVELTMREADALRSLTGSVSTGSEIGELMHRLCAELGSAGADWGRVPRITTGTVKFAEK